MNLKFIILLFACLLLSVTCNSEEKTEYQQVGEIEQTIEVTVDNDPIIPQEEEDISSNIEEEEVDSIVDCGIFER